MPKDRLEVRLFLAVGALAWLCVFLPRASGAFFLLDDFQQLTSVSQLGFGALFGHALAALYRPVGFALMKAEFAFFGWQTPAGYALVSGLLHTLNALLLTAAARRSGLSPAVAWMAGALFLASATSAEAFLWLACQFDLAAVMLTLLFVLAGLSALERGRPIAYVASGGLLAAALLAKESAVFAPFLLAALVFRTPVSTTRRARLLALSGSIGLGIALALAARVSTLALTRTHYGNPLALFAAADLPRNLGLSMKALFDFPSEPAFGVGRWLFRFGSLSLFGLVALAFLRRRRESALLCLAIGAALGPVLWVEGGGFGRLLYAASACVALLAALGWETWRTAESPLRRLALPAGVLALALAVLSLAESAQEWNAASALARSALEQFEARLDASRIFVPNLPQAFAAGPPLLRCSSFRLYFTAQGRRCPPVRCESVVVARSGSGVVAVSSARPERTSDYAAPAADESVLKLAY